MYRRHIRDTRWSSSSYIIIKIIITTDSAANHFLDSSDFDDDNAALRRLINQSINNNFSFFSVADSYSMLSELLLAIGVGLIAYAFFKWATLNNDYFVQRT